MIINTKNISKGYKEKDGKRIVLTNFSLKIAEGDQICLFGRSGCGKTTVLNLIAGLTAPDRGNISVSKKNLKIGYVFQEPRLLPWLSVKDNISLPLHGYDSSSINKKVENIINLVHLKPHANKFPSQLSGGEQQRVSLARALVNKPDILLLDEPFSHLDEITAKSMRTELKKIINLKPVSLILVTHNPIEAIYFADKIVVMTRKDKGVNKIIKIKKRKKGFDDFYGNFLTLESTRDSLNKLMKLI